MQPSCIKRNLTVLLVCCLQFRSKVEKTKYFALPIEIKETVQKITQIAFAWDSTFAQTLCTLEGKGRGNLTSFQNLFKFPFHDLQPTVHDNEVDNCSCFWEVKYRNCGDYTMSRATNKIFSFFPSSPLSLWPVRLCIRICIAPCRCITAYEGRNWSCTLKRSRKITRRFIFCFDSFYYLYQVNERGFIVNCKLFHMSRSLFLLLSL